MKLFDRNGKAVEVPDDQVPDALSSGQYGAPAGTRVPVRMDGDIGTVPIEHLSKALQGGAEVVPQSVFDKAQLQAQYGDAGHAAEAFGTEALDTATLGLSNTVIGGLGGQKVRESIRKSQEANPTATGLGTATGIVAPVAADIAFGGTLTPELAAAAAEKGLIGAGEKTAARAGEKVLAENAPKLLGAGERSAANLARAPEGRVVEGILEDAPRPPAPRGPETIGEVVPNAEALPNGVPPPAQLPPGPTLSHFINAEAPRVAAPARGVVDAEWEAIGQTAAQETPEIADVIGHAPRPAPEVPGVAPQAAQAAQDAARVERLARDAEAIADAHEAGAAAARASEAATGKGVIRQAVDTALFGPSRVVNGMGESVENAVRRIVGREAETALGRIAQDAVAKAARGAVEGGIYNVGNEVGHQFLQDDPDLSGERLASAWFNGAILGGAFGAGLGVLGRGSKEALTKAVGNEGVAKYLSDKAGEHMWHAAGPTKKMTAEAEKYAGGVAKVGNLIRTDAEQLMGRTPRTREELLKLSELMQEKHAAALDAVFDRLDEKAQRKMRPALGEVLEDIDYEIDKLEARAANADPLIAYKNRIIDALKARDPATGLVDNTTPIGFKQLRDFRVTADESSKFNATTDNATRDAFRQIRHIMEKRIEVLAKPHLNDAGGNLLKDYKAAKAGYQAGKLLEKAATSGVSAEKTNMFFSLTDKMFGLGAGAVLGHATGPVGAFVGEQAAELASKYVRKNFDFVVSDVLSKLANVAKGASVLDAAQATTAKVQKRLDQGASAVRRGLRGEELPDLPLKTGPQTYEARRNALLNAAAQHEGVMDHLQQVTSPLDRAAPNVASSLSSAALRTLTYLMDALPKPPPKDPSSLTPVDWEPSDPAKAAFNRKYDMSVNPDMALALVARGQFGPDHAEALNATHPKMKADMAAKLRRQLDKESKPPPAHMRPSIKLFLGVPQIDPALGRTYQASYAPPAAPKPQLKRPLKMADNTSLP